ncbi:Receptor-like protein kinase [Quillaja saponaria]|uniref:Receptor-like protein kinase n=1 Tax=Quillaja saponaria TaxID=32244 RepID=A0AAD7P5I8_QUISA|nr:Receptor-like protein kinase [Quillaja saponaria]
MNSFSSHYHHFPKIVGLHGSSYDPRNTDLLTPIIYLNCTNPVVDDGHYVDTAPCIRGNSDSKGHTYAILEQLGVKDLKVGCQVKLIAVTFWEWWVGKSPNNVSYTDIHKGLVYGFELSWMDGVCEKYCGKSATCYFNITSKLIHCEETSLHNNCDKILREE